MGCADVLDRRSRGARARNWRLRHQGPAEAAATQGRCTGRHRGARVDATGGTERTRAGTAAATAGGALAGAAAVSGFEYRRGQLCADGVPLADIAESAGTPTYVYSRALLEASFRAYADALAGHPHLVCYALKANSSLAVLNVFARLGSGFDIVSGGELARVIAAGGDPTRVVFSGVGKTIVEMEAALDAGILCFNVESAGELDALASVAARKGRTAPVSFR